MVLKFWKITGMVLSVDFALQVKAFEAGTLARMYRGSDSESFAVIYVIVSQSGVHKSRYVSNLTATSLFCIRSGSWK